jgi:hypothetical protein
MARVVELLEKNLELQQSGKADPEISAAVNKAMNEALVIFFQIAKRYLDDVDALKKV